MFDRYVKHIEEGGIDPSVEPLIMNDIGACVQMDAQAGLGHIAACNATSIAIERAKQYGISCVTVRNCNHVGACGIYARIAAAQDCIGICVAVSRAGIAPWGGKQALLGINAIGIAAPVADKPDFLFDAAMSRTAMGRITKAGDLGQAIPGNWALDAQGNPTTDPNQAKSGSLLPIGEHKGYGLDMALEMLAVLLGGGEFAHQATSWILQPELPMRASFVAMAISIPNLTEPDQFKNRFKAWAELLVTSPKRDGFDHIHYPGEIEAQTYEQRMETGIPIDGHTYEMFSRLASRFGVVKPQLEIT
jgi:LDH2 family malate/lactate/ureidoglycolate dehydrogenase